MAYGFTIFCDDIREELGGKTSFIGSYRDSLFVHGEFPFVLPKFGICATYVGNRDQAPGEITLNVFLPGDDEEKPSISGTLPAGEASIEPGQHYSTEAKVIFAPLVLPRAGEIKVRFKVNDEIIKAGVLKVDKARPS
jgi:hypothetical protein